MIFEHVVKVAICTPVPAIEGPAGKHLSPIATEFHRARQQLIAPFGFNLRELYEDGKEVGEARCSAVAHARELGCEFLFFLDYDVLVPQKALHRLVVDAQNNPDIDVFSGVYCVKMEPPVPLIYKDRFGNGAFWDWTPGDFLVDGIVGCGMGCTLIRLSLFDRLGNSEDIPWFKTVHDVHPETETNVFVTEDLWFCRRAVEEAGAKIAIDTGILCAHIDPATGVQYVLPENSLPGKRLREFVAREAKHAA